MSEPFVVEVERSGFIESTHLVDVAVVDRGGSLVASAGEPARMAAFRSSSKPIQARVALEAGWQPPREELLALACASHNGEPRHVEGVRAILSAAGVPESALGCPQDVPAFPESFLGVSETARVYHNCSGKHASMLGACAAAGWPLEGYRDASHPLQVRVRARIGALTGHEQEPLVDGCGVPTFVAPLHGLARAFLAIDDGGPEAAAMRAHPFMVAGTARFDTDLMSALRGALSKSGAEGLCCVSAGGFGVALKSRDGGARARGPVVLAVLRALNLAAEAVFDAFAAHREVQVMGGGVPVGRALAHGILTRH